MQFTLIYSSDLPPNGSVHDKWKIRREIEPQLRRLCNTPPFDALSRRQDPNADPSIYMGRSIRDIDFIPVLKSEHGVRAEIKILMLSSEIPGGVIHCGDIDNRMKTLFDAMSIPSEQQIPSDPEFNPDRRVYCLLDDDRLITSVTVESERNLRLNRGSREALVVIRIRPIVFLQNAISLTIAT